MTVGRIAGVVLAAGESSRMGRDKALLRYRGRTFLETILNTLRQAEVAPVVVVLGHHAEAILREVKMGNATVVINANYSQGQTSSLLRGLKALEADEPEAIVLCLVDHPAVSPESIRLLSAAYGQSSPPVVVPTFEGRRGHPVLIGRALFEELKGLSPAEGANTVIRKHRAHGREIEVPDSGILMDIDDPESYRQWANKDSEEGG